MAVSVYAGRYARTIFRMALDKKEINRWQSDLRKLDGLMGEKALATMLEDPKVKWAEKEAELKRRLGDVNPLAIKLVALLTAKGKLAQIGDIAAEYQRLVDIYHGVEGVETAEVITAIPLDEAYQLKLAERITAIVDKPIVLKTKVDPAILGGIVIRVGDRLIDGSLRSKLEALRKELGASAK